MNPDIRAALERVINSAPSYMGGPTRGAFVLDALAEAVERAITEALAAYRVNPMTGATMAINALRAPGSEP